MTAYLKIILAATLLTPGLYAQGSLTPPAGPAPSMKTLGQIEPRTVIESLPFLISSEGSYYVATNLTVPADTNGITISASGVTLDLGGFFIKGTSTSRDAVVVNGGATGTVVQNGTISGTETGIAASNASKITVERVNVTATRGIGINVGPDSSVSYSSATLTDATGIKAGARSRITDSRATENLGAGIEAADGTTLQNCVINRNDGDGVLGGHGVKLVNITARENGAEGIQLGDKSSIIDSMSIENRDAGVRTGTYAFVSRVSATFNHAEGIAVGSSSSVLDSTASGNAGLGISAGAGAHIANAKAESNAAGGIFAQEGSTVRDCTASRNSNDGIHVTSECTVTRNTCNNNINIRAAAGVHASGMDNMISENTLVSNDRGLALDVGGNLVTKNSATNNSLNYYVIGDQTMGPIVDIINDPLTVVSPVANFAF